MRNFSKRFLTMLLAVAMVFSLSGMTAFAADEDVSTYDVGEEPALNSDGYYEIATPENLEWFADQVNNQQKYSINAILTEDIDVSESESFSTIASVSSQFYAYTGTFDGDGHTITLDINNPDANYQGLFGYTRNATICNLTVEGCISGKQYVGGIAGKMEGGTTTGCINKASVSGTSNYVGGIAGDFNSISSSIDTGHITDCGNEGTVTSTAYAVGGIAGETTSSANFAAEISGCYNHGDIEGPYQLGGIVGRNGYQSNIDSCYNTGNITETERTTTGSTYCSGGLVGFIYGSPLNISNSFNRGAVTTGYTNASTSRVGALVGGADGSNKTLNLDHVYYLEGTCASYYGPNSSGTVNVVDDSVASKTAEEMQEIEFLDLINENLAYTQGTDHPILKWETEERSSYMALREEYDEDLLLDSIDYTPESWEAFETVLEAAGELLNNPDATDEQLDEMLVALREAKGDLVWIEVDYTVKYAVSIYDINNDKDEDGNTLGLTFGPATASHSYIRDYNAHLTQEEYESGEGVCLHWMSWKDIIRQSKEDPEAFRDCMNNGCTHSIEIELNDTLLNPSYTFVRMTGDGCGILYYSIATSYLQVNYGNSDLHNYGATTFRTTLNTASYSLLSCFPEDLQNGIVAKKTSYAQTAGSSIAEYCYDKLWLFSLYELNQGGTPVEGNQYYRPTSENTFNSESNRTYKLYNYYENGDYGDWMLPRSLYGEYDKSIYSVHYLGDGEYGTITGGGSGGLSPGFCLAGPEEDQELSAFAVYSADDSSLTFYTDYTVPTKGNTYNDKTVTAVYKDVDQTVAASADDIPWADVCTDATEVVIDSTFADAQPTSFAYWFDGFANAAFSGLANMDTTNVTSMSYMFHDCSALTRLDLSDWDTTSVTDGEQFATGCPDLQWVRIGEDTNIFTLSQNVDQPDWYDSRTNGSLVSSNYLQDVTEAGTYWSYTEETEGYITIKSGDETNVLTYETIDAAIANAERDTFTCGSRSVTARFVLLSDLIGIDYDFCSYTVTAASDESVTSGLPTDTYLYKTEDGEYRTAVNGGPESQWVSDPDTIEVVVDHAWENIEWTWTGLPVYCTTDNPDFEPLSVTAIQPWNVVESLSIATLAGDTIDAAATAAAICKACGKTETVDAVLTAEYISDEPTEYVGALAEITATATFSDGQKATDAVKVLAPATGELEVNYMREDETVATDAVPYANINELINKTEPFAIQYISSGGRDTELTMPFVSITDALGMSEDENFCCFYAHGEDGFTVTIPADAYLYQRNEADSSNNSYYYRTAVGITPERTIVRSSQAFVSYVSCIDVQYMHQWGTPEWTWSDDHSSAAVTVACTKENESGLAVCNYSETVDATIDVTAGNGYTVYTATATLIDGTVVTDVQRVEDNREAFAVYSADDNSLTFAYDNAPAVGGQYNGKTVTTVYDNVDSVSVTSSADIPWYSLAADITSVTIDASFKEARPTSLRFWFYRMANATFSGLENIDTSEVTTLYSMFEGCSSLETADLSGWDTSQVTNLGYMFSSCSNLTSVNVSDWDTSQVTNMTHMFYNCYVLTDMDLSGWNTSNVTSTDTMFYQCFEITSLGDLSGWDTANDTNMSFMFHNCSSLESVNLSDWDTSNVTTMLSMFECCYVLESLDLSGWDTSNVTTMRGMFNNCYALTSVDVSGWDTSNVTEMSYLFSGCTALETLDLSDWDTTAATGYSSFALGGTAPACVKLGEKTDIFTKGQLIGTQIWYDSQTNGTIVSSNYLQDAAYPGEYWSDTKLVEPNVWGVTIESNLTDNTKTYDGAGANLSVSATVTPEDATVSYAWYKVDGDGNETLLDGDGSVYTTGSSVADSGTYKCVVTATNIAGEMSVDGTIVITIEKAAQDISYAQSEIEKTVGDDTFTNPLTETSVSTDADAGVVYASSDPSVATVDVITGEVTILAAGETTITATAQETANYTEASASYKLTVAATEPEPVQPTVSDVTISSNLTDNTKTYDGAGANLTVAAQVTPDAAEVTCQWYGPDGEAIDGAVSSVFTTGSNVADSGTYKCVVTATNDGLTAAGEGAIAITITAAAQEISFAESAITKAVGDKPFTNELIETTVDTDGGAAITYTSSDESIATVDENGEVTILATGGVTITATVSATENYAAAAASYELTIEASQEPAPTVDKTALEEAIDEAEALNKDDYTEESWNTLETALAAAEAVAAEESATQDDVDKALEALQNAINGLVEKASVDKDVLEVAIANAEALNKGDYTEESWNALQTALEAAKAVDGADDATQSDVDQATIDLMAAIAGLEIAGEEPDTEADKADLLKEYSDAMGLSESDYTPESWTPFANALKDAQEVLLTADATQADIEAASEALKTAMDNLVKKPADSGTGGEPKNGLCRITSGELWGYYVDDKVDTSYTGFAHNDNGDWWVVNGYVRFDTNSVEKDTTGKNGDKGVNEKGAWWYVIGSKVQHNFTGLANYKNVNGWWYIQDGQVDFSHNGVDKNNNGWWYVLDGKVRFDFTGLANYKNANGWWYISKGKVNFNHNGVDHNKNGWWYVTGGKVQFGFTGLANYRNENGWWYIKDGKVDFTYTGRATNKNGTWNVVNGKVVF